MYPLRQGQLRTKINSIRLPPHINLPRTRSLINTLASIAMPSTKAMAAIPGRVSVACNMDNTATKSNKLNANDTLEIMPKNM